MTDNVRNLIDSIVSGSEKNILFYAKLILENDKTEKDRRFCQTRLEKINHKEERIEVPGNCSMFLLAEKDANINTARYYLSEEEFRAVEDIRKMHLISKKLAEKDIKHVNAMLLHGIPGTGKTMFARYVAKSLGLPFLYIKLSYLVDFLLGNTQKNLSRAFEFANKMECVFMLDEIDSIAVKRGTTNDVGDISRVTITMMQELDNISGNVVCMAATNRLDILDPAIVSRFGNIHEVKKFNQEQRTEMVNKYLSDVGIDYTDKDIDAICRDDSTQRELEKKLVSFITEKYWEEMFEKGENEDGKEKTGN